MATTVEAVHAHLERDPTLTDVLLRDLLRLRRTARWLIEEHGWDTTEEAVVSALRRYARDHDASTLTDPRSTLTEHRVDARGGLALLTVPRLYEVQGKLLQAWKGGNVRDLLAVLPSNRSLRLLVEADNVRDLRKELGPHTVEDVRQPVTSLTLARDERPADVAVTNLGLTALAREGVEVLEVLSSTGECSFLVPDEDRMQAFEVLSALTSPGVSPSS